MIEEITQRPPTIGMVGVSGVGKSSTINKFFNTNLPVSDIVATTKEFRNVDLQLQTRPQETLAALPIPQQIFQEIQVMLRVVDAPGLGEDIARDPQYIQMYHEHLPKCDAILWIITARNRALALDQQYLREFAEFHPKMAFGMNQVDLLEPLDWDHVINLPTDEFDKVIKAAAEDRKKRLEDIVQRPVTLVPYSSKYGYNLDDLYSEMTDACKEPERSLIFSILKSFDWKDFIPSWVLEQALGDSKQQRTKTPSGRGLAGFLKSLTRERRKE